MFLDFLFGDERTLTSVGSSIFSIPHILGTRNDAHDLSPQFFIFCLLKTTVPLKGHRLSFLSLHYLATGSSGV